jgi:hypothetical protein
VGATIDTVTETLLPRAPRAPRPLGGAGDVAAARRRSARWAERAAAAVVVVGSAVRIEQFLWRRSLWLDEALVTANIVQRSFSGLLRPLSGHQGAPVGWLWAERTAVLVLGNNEDSLRVVPLAAGMAAILLAWAVARRLLGPWPAVLATAVVAFSPAAVRYSVEVKQYSSDLAIGLGLLLLALRADASRSRSSVWAWGAAGAVAVWWAHPAVLVLAGTAAALAVAAVMRHDGRQLRLVGQATALWLTSFVVDWWVVLRGLGHDPFLHLYWKAGFAPRPLAPASLAGWLARTPARLVHDPGSLPMAWVAAAAIVVGLAATAARRPVETAVVVFPLLVGLGAAVLGAYPLLGRMALWTLPVIAIGVAGAVAAAGRARAWMAVALAAALLAGPTIAVGRVAHDPTTWSDVRPLLQAVRPYLRPGDLIWAHSADTPTAVYYGVSTGAEVSSTVVDDLPGGVCAGRSDLAAVAEGHRVWLVYGYRASSAPADEQRSLDGVFASSAHLVDRIARPQATATLWDFGAPPDLRPPAPSAIGCVGVAPVTVRPTGLRSGPLGSGRPT